MWFQALEFSDFRTTVEAEYTWYVFSAVEREGGTQKRYEYVLTI